MKKTLRILITVISILFLTACTTGNNIFKEVRKGNVGTVQKYIKNGGDINAKEQPSGLMVGGDTLLTCAVLSDRLDIVKLLIDAKADLNASGYEGTTALMYAGRYRNTDAFKLLLNAGADVNAKDKYGSTVLMQAAANGDIMYVDLLIKAGADVNAQSDYGTTALMNAAFDGQKEIMKLLIDAKADTELKNKDGKTAAMMLAPMQARKGDYRIVVNNIRRSGYSDSQDKITVNIMLWGKPMTSIHLAETNFIYLLEKNRKGYNPWLGEGPFYLVQRDYTFQYKLDVKYLHYDFLVPKKFVPAIFTFYDFPEIETIE